MNNRPTKLQPLGRTGVIVAARSSSSRLPGKVMRPLGGVPMILFLLQRLAHSRDADEIILATSTLPSDDALTATVEEAGFPVFRGALEDVVRRYVDAADRYHFDTIVRVTGDCPFVDAEGLDHSLQQAAAAAPFDLATTKGRFPVGIDYKIYPASAMAALDRAVQLDAEEREHLTLHVYRHRADYRLVELEPRPEWRSAHAFTIDTAEDYARAQAIVSAIGCNDFSIARLIEASQS